MRVVHLTSVHPRYDTRIFLKQCRSLARAGYQVTLIVADGKGSEIKEGVAIVDVGPSHNRLRRMVGATRRVLAAARKVDADIYHLHDPELMPAGLVLRRSGKRVVFDAHEDLPKQLRGKSYLHPLVRRFMAAMFSAYERRACARFSGVIAATPCIQDKFLAINPRTTNINNFPLPGELESGAVDWSVKQAQVTYVGGIDRMRGILEVVRAMAQVRSGARLQLAGRFSEANDETQARALAGWAAVDAMGFQDRSAVRGILRQAVAGIVTFLPLPNHVDAQPNKMFEYMSAGVPVIASNFPLWREIIEGNKCGLCVDPSSPQEIAQAIDYLLTHPTEAEQMGRNGQKAVRERYNWSTEEKKLLDFYRQLIG